MWFLTQVKTLTKTQQPVSQDSQASNLQRTQGSKTHLAPNTQDTKTQDPCPGPTACVRCTQRIAPNQSCCAHAVHPACVRCTQRIAPDQNLCVQPACVRPPSESHGCALNTSIPRFGRASSFPTRLGGYCLLAQLSQSKGDPGPLYSPSNRRVP